MSDCCTIRLWIDQKSAELRSFIGQAEQPEIIAELQQIREDLAACCRCHEDSCADCATKPAYDRSFDAESELVDDVGPVIRYESPEPISRREATTRCRH